jgi:hypothetical protein
MDKPWLALSLVINQDSRPLLAIQIAYSLVKRNNIARHSAGAYDSSPHYLLDSQALKYLFIAPIHSSRGPK